MKYKNKVGKFFWVYWWQTKQREVAYIESCTKGKQSIFNRRLVWKWNTIVLGQKYTWICHCNNMLIELTPQELEDYKVAQL